MESGTASFQKITSGEIVNDSGYSYGFAWGDYDKDGDLDLAVANTFSENQKNALYKNNNQNGNKFITVKCTGTITNRSAIGVRVRVKTVINGTPVWQIREVEGQSGYCGQNLILHFGLGNASVIDSIKVEWPAGGNQYFTNVPVNRSVTITENGTLISVSEKKTETIKDFTLFQNYPNPFNPVTVIRYNLAVSNFVVLKVYDALGKEAATIVNEKQSAGLHSVEFNGNNLPGGIYFYTLKTSSNIETRKLMLIK